MPEPALTRITGTAYAQASEDNTPDVVTNAKLFVFKVFQDGSVLQAKKVPVPSDNGEFDFYLPRNSVAYIYGNFAGFDKKKGEGTRFVIPDAAEATLGSLLPAVSFTAGGVSQGTVTSAVAAEASLREAADEGIIERVEALEAGGSGEVLLHAATVSLNTNSFQSFYIIPAGKEFTPTRAIIDRATEDLSVGSVGDFSLRDSVTGAWINFDTAIALAWLTSPALFLPVSVSSEIASPLSVAGSTLQVRMAPARAGSATVRLRLFGVLEDV